MSDSVIYVVLTAKTMVWNPTRHFSQPSYTPQNTVDIPGVPWPGLDRSRTMRRYLDSSRRLPEESECAAIPAHMRAGNTPRIIHRPALTWTKLLDRSKRLGSRLKSTHAICQILDLNRYVLHPVPGSNLHTQRTFSMPAPPQSTIKVLGAPTPL